MTIILVTVITELLKHMTYFLIISIVVYMILYFLLSLINDFLSMKIEERRRQGYAIQYNSDEEYWLRKQSLTVTKLTN